PPTSTLFPYTTLFRSYVLGNGINHYLEQNEKGKEALLPRLKSQVESRYNKLHMNVEEALLAAQLNLYYAKGGEDLISPYVAKLGKELNGDFTDYIAEAFQTSIFRSKESAQEFLENADKEKLDND